MPGRPSGPSVHEATGSVRWCHHLGRIKLCFDRLTVHGWAKGSKRVPKGPPKRRKRVSLLLALDAEGVVAYKVIQGAFNGASYSEFLATLPSHRTIIADNCAIHRSRVAVETAKQKHQTLLYTPPYCPWFNPVEFAFSKTKSASSAGYRRDEPHGMAGLIFERFWELWI